MSTPEADFLARNMTDAERALADAIFAVMSSENIDTDRAEAVMMVAWLREHGWELAARGADTANVVSTEKMRLNPDPLAVVDVKSCADCGMRAPWCKCGSGNYR